MYHPAMVPCSYYVSESAQLLENEQDDFRAEVFGCMCRKSIVLDVLEESGV